MLKDRIRAKHGSIHAFARRMRGQIPRGLIYQVCAGTYPGNMSRQQSRIADALEKGETSVLQIMRAIKEVACGVCNTRQPCDRCGDLFFAQARAVARLLQ